MRKNNAIGAKPFWYDPVTRKSHQFKANTRCEYFHSSLEFQIWVQLKSHFDEGFKILRQVPIVYKPKTTTYSELAWKVDFSIYREATPLDIWYVEAKGDWILHDSGAFAELQHKIQFLEYVYHELWERVLFVSTGGFKLDREMTIYTPTSLIELLKTIL